jgi:hypothetical protein
LDRTPASDLIEGTILAWAEAITAGRAWDQERDAPRIREAFVTLARTRRQWPAPADFLEAVPRVRVELKALPRSPSDPAKAAAAIEAARKALRA